MMHFFDTHCHIHEIDAVLTPVYEKWHSDGRARTAESVLMSAREVGVSKMLVIGTTLEDSEQAVLFAQAHDGVWASVGLHPHEAKKYTKTQKATSRGLSSQSSQDASQDSAGGALGPSGPTGDVVVVPELVERFTKLTREPKVVAVGECGLDYFYGYSDRSAQRAILELQLRLAIQNNLPLSFHVRGVPGDIERDAFADFWPIFDKYASQGSIRGVMHSFTDTRANMEQAVRRGLYIGVNGIATFTREQSQLVTFRTIPQQLLLLETDAPFLTPKPFRGKICLPEHIVLTAEFLAKLRDEPLETVASYTTANASKLWGV